MNMSMDKQNEIDALASKHLGQKGGEGYSDKYDISLLVFIPRFLNREAYGIKEDNLPFIGVDTWNAYEVSAITNKGLPVAGMLKIVYPANTVSHVESKSLKLYLNSFNMTKLGNTQEECIKMIEETVSKDLSAGIGEKVEVTMFTSKKTISSSKFYWFETLEDTIVDIDDIQFDSYSSDKNQLQIGSIEKGPVEYQVHSSLLRSNCRVTGQPDWGDIYIYLNTINIPDSVSLLKYIISHRKVNHFHEEICEMVYMHLLEKYKPIDIMVACLYTRRGGIDINPIRTNNPKLIPHWFNDNQSLIKKTLRQ